MTISNETKESIGQAMDGCLDSLRRYAPSTTSGNPPLPDSQKLRNVINTLEDVIDALAEPDESDEDLTEGLSDMHIVESEEPAPSANPFPGSG